MENKIIKMLIQIMSNVVKQEGVEMIALVYKIKKNLIKKINNNKLIYMLD